VVITHVIRADQYRGKRIRYSGFVRSHEVRGDGAALWLRADGPPGGTAFDNMSARPIMGTRDWTRYDVVLDIPASAVGLAFGFFLSGPGIAWVDDLSIDIVESDIPVTAGPWQPAQPYDSTALAEQYERLPRFAANLDFEGLEAPEEDAAAVDWVRSNATALTGDDPNAPLSDLAPMRDIVGTARMVALGEATHGTREFFRMKHRVFRYLVSELGFTHFAIEASFPEALAVDHYVQTGQGDPAALVKGMYFWTWSTEEVADLVRWMRNWNASGGQPRVRFVGFDMQFPGAAIDSVVAFVRRMDPNDATAASAGYSCLNNYRNTPSRPSALTAQYFALSQATKEACRAAIVSVEALLADRAPLWRATVSKEAMDLAQRFARLVTQWEGARVASPYDFYARDEAMAENAAWWLNTAPAGSRVMLWAHNGHVTRARRAMGFALGQQYAAGYVPIALTFGSGTFNAVTQNGSTFSGLGVHRVLNAERGSIEALFGATGATALLFDARRVTLAGAPRDVLERTWLRSIGSTFDPNISTTSYRTNVLLPDDFAGVIWFAQGSPSRFLP
jgi:erythromycin esterase